MADKLPEKYILESPINPSPQAIYDIGSIFDFMDTHYAIKLRSTHLTFIDKKDEEEGEITVTANLASVLALFYHMHPEKGLNHTPSNLKIKDNYLMVETSIWGVKQYNCLSMNDEILSGILQRTMFYANAYPEKENKYAALNNLTNFAHNFSEIWGNDYGHLMFDEDHLHLAYGKKKITDGLSLLEIAFHWKAVAKKLGRRLNVNFLSSPRMIELAENQKFARKLI